MDESGVVRVVRAVLLSRCVHSPVAIVVQHPLVQLRCCEDTLSCHVGISRGGWCVCVCWGIGVKLDYCIYIQVRYNVWSADVVDVRSEAASETPEAQIKRSCLSSYQIKGHSTTLGSTRTFTCTHALGIFTLMVVKNMDFFMIPTVCICY